MRSFTLAFVCLAILSAPAQAQDMKCDGKTMDTMNKDIKAMEKGDAQAAAMGAMDGATKAMQDGDSKACLKSLEAAKQAMTKKKK